MNIVVVGASGYAGRHIVEQAHRRGHQVRAVVRDKARAESAGAWGASSLTNMVDEWAVGDVTDRSWAAGVCEGLMRLFRHWGDPAEGRPVGY